MSDITPEMEAHKLADLFPMMEGEEFNQLKEDIRKNGLLQPIIIFEGKILDGRNRYKACNEVGIIPEFKTYEGDKPLEFVISLNLKRRHLTDSQKAVLSLDILPIFEEEAKKRMSEGGRGGKISTPLKSREQASKLMNVSARYIQDAKRLKLTSPELLEEVKSGKKDFSDIKREQRLDKIKKQREELQKEVLEQPIGLFDVIVIDPPWRYDGDKYEGREDNLPMYEAEGFRGSSPYPTMSLEEIKNIKLPIKKDCVLLLWTTNLFLPDCYSLLKEWGFELKSMITWDKQHIGTGRWFRSQTEHCLFAIKGKPFFNNTKWSTLISEKRTTHSTKPEIFYKMVDEICAGRKLDYFGRKKKEGWIIYGDEVK